MPVVFAKASRYARTFFFNKEAKDMQDPEMTHKISRSLWVGSLGEPADHPNEYGHDGCGESDPIPSKLEPSLLPF